MKHEQARMMHLEIQLDDLLATFDILHDASPIVVSQSEKLSPDPPI
jgi:hypothetical protein